jgi:hypothetical protein
MKVRSNSYYSIMEEYEGGPPSPEEILGEARDNLIDSGVVSAEEINIWDAPGAVFLAEAVNWAAKTVSPWFYGIKAEVWAAASEIPGVECGWGEWWETVALSADGAGTVWAHDPYGEMARSPLGDRGLLGRGWSGLRRQHHAFLAFSNANVRRLLAEAESLGWSNSQLERFISRVS